MLSTYLVINEEGKEIFYGRESQRLRFGFFNSKKE